MDLGAGFFLLLRLSTVSSRRDKITGGTELRVRGHGRGTLRGTLGEVVLFMVSAR